MLFVQLLSGEFLTYRSHAISSVYDLRKRVARDLSCEPEEINFVSLTGQHVGDSHRIIHEVDELYHAVVSPFHYALSYEDKTFSLHRLYPRFQNLVVKFSETEELFYTGERAFYWVSEMPDRYAKLPATPIHLECCDLPEEAYEIMRRDLLGAGQDVPQEVPKLVQEFCKELLNLELKVN